MLNAIKASELMEWEKKIQHKDMKISIITTLTNFNIQILMDMYALCSYVITILSCFVPLKKH